MRNFFYLCGYIAALLLPSIAQAENPPARPQIHLRDGDRVALIGATFFERDRHFSQFETMFRSRFAGVKFSVRNFAWPGDTTTVQLRPLNFGSLEKHLKDYQPTVAFVSYGQGEAFDGSRQLEKYLNGYRQVLDSIAKSGARVVIVSPTPLENPGAPLPDPTSHNPEIEKYSEATRRLAAERKLPFVDLYHAVAKSSRRHLTENGLHYSDAGYAHVADLLAHELGWGNGHWRIEIAADNLRVTGRGAQPGQVTRAGSTIVWTVSDKQLVSSDAADVSARVVAISGLPAGSYTLKVDGQPLLTASAAEWAAGRNLTQLPEHRQVQELRALARWKETLFFNRWRAHNGEYIYGRRASTSSGYNSKKDGGNSGNPSFPIEMAKFDQLLKEADQQLAELSRPAIHTFELEPQSTSSR